MEINEIKRSIHENGYLILEKVIPSDLIIKLKSDLETSLVKEKLYHEGKDYRDQNMVLLCSLYGNSFISLVENEALLNPFESVLGEGCIIYAYTSSSMPPNGKNFSARIHVDSPRLIPGYVTNMGATILLDDFTEENGATWFLPKSHNQLEQPSLETFNRQALRVIAPAGSVFFFNARLWHSGGENSTTNWRHAVTINMCRPWMKQRIDIPRAMQNIDTSKYSKRSLQKLGFLAQVPASYDEYYAPPHLRKYTQATE